MVWKVLTLRSKNKHFWARRPHGETSVAMCQLTAVVHKSIQQITSRGSILASGSGCRRAQLSHLTDIWSISAHIWLLIFCSVWVEKKRTLRYLRESQSPRRDHSPHAHSKGRKVPRLDNLHWFDPVSSQACNLLQRDPGSEKCRRILCGHGSFTAVHSLT